MGDTRKQLLMAVLVLSAGGALLTTPQPVSADTILHTTESLATTQSIEGIAAVTPSAGVAPVITDTSDTKTKFANHNLWALGDSLAVGYNGAGDSDSWSENLHYNMKYQTLHNEHAHSGSQIAGPKPSGDPIHFSKTVSDVISNAAFTSDAQPVVMIELGVNDLNYSSNNLKYVQERLSQNIRTLRQANPNVVIYGILPFENYLGGDFNTIHGGGYSFNQLTDALTEVYASFKIPVLDWVNYDIDRSPNSLGDKTVHPTGETYAHMSEIIADFMDKNANVLTPGTEKDTGKYFYSNGWHWNDKGEAQYGLGKGSNGVTQLAAGAQKIAGTYYWFDPKSGAMATRAGDVDPSLIYYIQEREGLSNGEMLKILNNKSGLLGVSTLSSDMRDLEEVADTNEHAKLALDMFLNRVIRYLGQYTFEMGGVDAIVFTAGIGENAANVREDIIDRLDFLGIKLDKEANNVRGVERVISTDDSTAKVLLVPTNEELEIARDVERLKAQAGK